jgi:hypothetical protein
MGRRTSLLIACALACCCSAIGAGSAAADDWFPHPIDATWTYNWTDSEYNPSGTVEQVTVASENATTGCGWNLAWTGNTQVPLSGSGGAGASGGPSITQPDNGTMCFRDQNYGLQNTDWSASAAPINEPSLCAGSGGCANSLGSTLFDVIWGTRDPTISEPLLRGTTWNATGGSNGSVTSSNQYLGLQLVKVPAFPHGVVAAAVRSQIALAGTPGDDYGSGIRTTWWAEGVGPVKVVFDHVDGAITNATLNATNQKPSPARPDVDYFPMDLGRNSTYAWTNNRHMKQREVERVTVAAAANRSARLVVKSVSGPIRAAGNYVFALRLDGLRSTYGSSSAATLLKFPKIGHGRHFFNPLDFMVYGFGPVIPDYGVPGTTWHSGNAYDLSTFGVTGSSRVIGLSAVKVPAGRFSALEVRSSLSQKGFRYGSGVRTMWFAAGRGLVKLTFRHGDGSTDTVQLIK